MKILSAENDWPIPKFYGTCGRSIIVENVGQTLYYYYHDSWLNRAKVAVSLLDAAYNFTFKNPHFSFYLTDISPDNIAIDAKFNAKFIDLENILVVDRKVKDNLTVLNEVHKSEPLKNDENLSSFCPDEICSHSISDHNFYEICQILWQRNNAKVYGTDFLHSIPENILLIYPEVMDLIRQCSQPDSSLENRITFGIKLNSVLRKIVTHYMYVV